MENNVLASIAIVISILSLLVSIYPHMVDRSRVKILSKIITPFESEPYINLVVVNKGRRAIRIRLVGGLWDKKMYFGNIESGPGGGRVLEEHGRFESKLYANDLIYSDPNGEDFIPEVLFIEDTVGNRYFARESRKQIKELLKVK
ncbi:hypothetical protein [Comamonas testosteroni]|uniref:hypothetical protein n=1 Tax=Comamonas testosteroni TaxID=285 RepID=UPI00391D3D74